MYVTKDSYYKINRTVLKALALWPYQQSCFVRIQKILFAIILLTFILVQFMAFITYQYSTNLYFKILSFVFPSIFVTLKYFLFIIHADGVKHLTDQIRNDWSLLKDKLEIDIIKEYAYNARFLTISVMVFCCCATFSCFIFQLLPIILDIIFPLNESRPYELVVIAEYFVNQEKYIYALVLHEIVAGFIGMTALCATGVTVMTYILHACALLKITSYRIENAINKNIITIPSPRREYILYQRIVHAIVMHQRANDCFLTAHLILNISSIILELRTIQMIILIIKYRFTKFFWSQFERSYIVLIMVGVSCLSINLFRFFQLIILMNDIRDVIINALLIITNLYYMFSVNYAGQKILDHGIELFKAIYNGLWYAAPLYTQKLILFIMQKGARNVNTSVSSVFIVSLEGFATLLSMAISYFTVIYSTL